MISTSTARRSRVRAAPKRAPALTPQLTARMAEITLRSGTFTAACRQCGVSEHTFTKWRKLARDEEESGGGPHRDLLEAMGAARYAHDLARRVAAGGRKGAIAARVAHSDPIVGAAMQQQLARLQAAQAERQAAVEQAKAERAAWRAGRIVAADPASPSARNTAAATPATPALPPPVAERGGETSA